MGRTTAALVQLFFLAETEHDDYLLAQLEELRENWLETCELAGLQDELPLTVVREAWLVRSRPRQTVPTIPGRCGQLLHADADACYPVQISVFAGDE